MIEEKKELEKKESEKEQDVKGQFVDPVIATPIAIFVLMEIGKGIISFITFKYLTALWKKYMQERWNRWWGKK